MKSIRSLFVILLLNGSFASLLPCAHADSPDASATVIEKESAALPAVTSRPRLVMMLDLNRARAAGFALLPGVDMNLGKRIVAYRDAHGPFSLKEDLLRVEGMSQEIFDKIRKKILIRKSRTAEE